MQIYNRELSWLAFNNRVLQEAQDHTVPLIQRLRFLGIFSNNQDEFIKVRVANLLRMQRLKDGKNQKTVEGYPVKDILAEVYEQIETSQKSFTDTYESILSEMEQNGIYVLNEKEISAEQTAFCKDYFSRQVSPLIVPLMIRKSTKMPFLSDQNVYHAVKMSLDDQKSIRYAIIPLPITKECPRFVQLPSPEGRKDIIFLDDIIRLCLNEIFFMFPHDQISAHTFKVIRDANLTVDDDISKSLLEKMEASLESRQHGEAVRMVYDHEMPDDLLEILTSKLKLKDFKILGSRRYHMMKYLMKFPVVNPALEYDNPPPLYHPEIPHFSSIIQVIKEKDIFLNFPYHTFNHVIDFLREAAIDPKVSRICITLYRTAEQSKVINVLINAAENGKEVIVLEELMARFDEEQNVVNSDKLQKAGIKVIHGIPGLKVHSKLIYVERKEKGVLVGYTYVGTGNFNESTAQIYSDFGLLTSHPQIALDANAVFEFLQNPHKHFTYKQLIVSPYFMRNHFEKLIEKEIRNKKKGKKAYIYAKFNGLTDTRMINLLYKASQAGVEIRLIIRGTCCLQPQVKGQSDHIRATSIVDKYLEHTRLFIFHSGGEEQTYISSADWMTRNLDNRIEVGVPILDKKIKKTIRDVFDIQWADNIKARDLRVLGKNNYIKKNAKKPCRSQLALYDYYAQKT
ncbi:MAG: polyphosphate kinase 1 [Tannerellaceae bacterium]|nr:polyphosphate kinase 1 [Tannerellaceae bacterium]